MTSFAEVEHAWHAVESDGLLQYDHIIPAGWNAARIAAEARRMIEALAFIDAAPGAGIVTGWLAQAASLPRALRQVMALELASGNPLRGIGSSDWPTPGSVVVSFGERFDHASQAGIAGVCWRRLDDPHYCRKEISQRVDGVEYLLLA